MDPGTIPPDLQQFVDHQLASGHYGSAEELICAGLKLLHQLRGEIQAGLDELDRGEGIEIEDEQSLRAFFEDIKSRGRERLGAA